MTRSFARVKVQDYEYLFFVVSDRPYNTSSIEKNLNEDLHNFGAEIDEYGLLVRPYAENAKAMREEVLAAPWPDDIRLVLTKTLDPFLLIIETDFDSFNPSQDRWAVVLLEDYEPDNLYRVFRNLARLVGDSVEPGALMTYLAAVTERQHKAKFGRIFRYVGVKPTVFGVSVDVSALLTDMAASDATQPRAHSGNV